MEDVGGWHVLELMDQISGVDVVGSHFPELFQSEVEVRKVLSWEHGVGVPRPRGNPVMNQNILFDVHDNAVIFEVKLAARLQSDILT